MSQTQTPPTTQASPASPPDARARRVHILRAGTFTDMHGQKRGFSAADLEAIASDYRPERHQAPIVVGHPQHNSPAFGWIKSLTATGDDLEAEVEQLDPAFVEAVRAGRYRTRSASLYPPDHPGNPAPGSWYLRHLGFLGGMPPAVKGLRGADLGEDAPLITLDLGACPSDLLPVTEDPLMPDTRSAAPGAPQTPELTATAADRGLANLSEQAARLARLEADLAARETAIAQREQAAAAQAEAVRRTEIASFCESLAEQAKLRQDDVKPLAALLAALPRDPALDFAAADSPATAQPPGSWLRGFLAGLPPLVELGEIATQARAKGQPATVNDAVIARRAQAYKARQDAAGQPLSFTEAVAAVELDLDKTPE